MVLPVFLLSACLGGGGSFDLDSVDTEAPRPAPKYQDVSSETPQARKDQGGYGFAMRLKRRNWHPRGNPKEDKIELSENDWEQTDNGDIKNPSKQKKLLMTYLEMREYYCKIQVKKVRVYLRLRTITISNTYGRVFFINRFKLNLKQLMER